MPGGRPTRSTRWRRRPARGTAWRSDAWPGGSSRTRILRRDRAGLPSEPGRGFFQNLPLLAEDLVLAPEPPQLLALFRGQAILAVAVVAIGLGNPVADRLRRRLELLRQLFRVPPGSHHLNEPPLELRRVRWSGLGHRELLFPRKGSGVHETGGTSIAVSGTRASIAWRTICASCKRKGGDMAAGSSATTAAERELV